MQKVHVNFPKEHCNCQGREETINLAISGFSDQDVLSAVWMYRVRSDFPHQVHAGDAGAGHGDRRGHQWPHPRCVQPGHAGPLGRSGRGAGWLPLRGHIELLGGGRRPDLQSPAKPCLQLTAAIPQLHFPLPLQLDHDDQHQQPGDRV